METKSEEDFSVPLIEPDYSIRHVVFKSDLSSELPVDEELVIKPSRRFVWSAWKDVMVLASGAFCYNFAYIAFLFNLSTLYDDANLVFTTLSLNCVSQLVTSLFLPALLVRKWGCKTTAVIAVSSVVTFSAAQFYPGFATFAPGSIILGFGNTCLWVTVGTYVSNVGLELAKAQKKRPDVVLSTLFGAVNFVRFGGAVAGNLVPYFLLSSHNQQESTNASANSDATACGASSCSERSHLWSHVWTSWANQSLQDLEDADNTSERTAVFAVFLAVGLLAPIVILLFLNPRRDLDDSPKNNVQHLLMATAYALKDPKHLLLMTTFLNAGLIRSFASGDFSKGFVLCSIGFKDVSLAATISNICYVGGTTTISLFVRAVGMVGAFTTINALCFLTLVGLLIWTPQVPMASVLLFVASGVMGAVMGAYNNLINTTIGLLFPLSKEGAYAAYRFHYAFGSLLGYAWAVGVCMNFKIWGLIGIVTVAQGSYLVLDYMLRKKRLFALAV